MTTSAEKLTRLLNRLRAARIHYGLSDRRDGAISLDAVVPG